MGGHFYRQAFYYYGFQKKIKDQINNNNKDREDEDVKIGYLINPEWIKEWRNRIKYNQMEKNLDNYTNVDFSNISILKKKEINLLKIIFLLYAIYLNLNYTNLNQN